MWLLAIGGMPPGLIAAQSVPDFRKAELPVEQRVQDLLGRMTVEEKARQLDMYSGCDDLLGKEQQHDHTHAKADAIFNPELGQKALSTLGVGSIHDLYPSPRLYNQIQAWVIQSSRWGIPALFLEEGLHGYMAYDQTVFPHSVNLAAAWNPELARRTGAAVAEEARANGVGMILGPVLDLARDPRWGRVEENFGEDPYLTGQLGLAYVRGMQGESLASAHSVIAEPKHFAAHGSPESGLNTAPVHCGERELRNLMLKPFEPAIRDGQAMGVMAAYHDIDGLPCTANPWLLTQVLRREWGFQGFVLSDLGAIRRLREPHHVAETPAEAIWLALNAGVDMQFYDFDHATFQSAIIEGVKNSRLSSTTLDQAVGRVLRVKFLLGLFDHPFVNETNLSSRSAEHLALSLESARQSMCLLRNENHLLPLKKDLKRLAVIGPRATIPWFGDYAEAAQSNSAVAMLEQIKAQVSPATVVDYADGSKLEEAVAKAKGADSVILALGEGQGISGEGFDRSELGLPGNQEALMKAVVETGVPTVLVLQNGRALALSWAAEHVPAILEAWYPGEFGGQAIAETLFGDNTPAGRLPVSFPRRVGQLPVYYNYYPSKNGGYVDGNDSPQFVFGFGLSYSTFQYDHLTVESPAAGCTNDVVVTVELKNSGSREADEVAQLYVRQKIASVATPVKALKGFQRVHLQPGQAMKVVFQLKQADLALWGAAGQWAVEPGTYEVTVGGCSEGGLRGQFSLK